MGRRHGLSSAADDATGATIACEALGTGYAIKADADKRARELTEQEHLQYEATRVGKWWHPLRVEEQMTPAKRRLAAYLQQQTDAMTPAQRRTRDREMRQAIAAVNRRR